LQTFEEVPTAEISEQVQGPFQVQSATKNLLNSLGKKMGKRTGFNVIESAQQRALSDFTFDLDASLLTTDTLKRRTYTVPFLEKGDKYSTFNLVLVADSIDNVLDQYVLQYEFDSIQYQTFEETKDFLVGGVTIKRFPFSSFFNDSNPGFLERCDEVFDANGDPVTCDQVPIDYGSGGGSGGGGGGGSGGTAWITPGGSTSGDGGSTGSGSGSSGGYGGTSCSWGVVRLAVPNYSGDYCQGSNYIDIIIISCGADPYSRKNNAAEGLMTCMDCSVSDFGSPAFTLTRDATTIDNLLLDYNLSDWHMAYLSNVNNTEFSSEFRSFLQSQANLDQKAAFITLTAQMEGVLTGQMTQNFGRAIDDLVAADLSNPAIGHLFSTYFSARAAFLKLSNPQKYYKNPNGNLNDPNNINRWDLYYDTSKEAIHWGLDLLGFVPFLGEPADLINGILYTIEGDGVNAALSTASAIPFLGWVTSGSKMGMKVIGSASDLNSRKVLRWFLDKDQIIKFGDSNQLRGILGLTDPTKQAHHIIPWANLVQNNPVVQKAAKSGEAFHLNEALNGVPVDTWRNQPNHEIYNNRIKALLDNFNISYPNASPDDAYNFLNSLITRIRTEIINNPEKHLNEIVFR
jgi:hypothetical protein